VIRPRSLTVAAAAWLALILSPLPAESIEPPEAHQFIESLADEAVSALTAPDIGRPERIQRFRSLFRAHFAVKEIARWILGRYWNTATEEQRAEYLNLFEDYIVASYVDRFAQYAGETLNVVRAVEEGSGVMIVFSDIRLPDTGSTPVRVNWRIEEVDGTLKVFDLVVEGVSMSTTMRSDFASIIRRSGGKVAALLDVLREKSELLGGSS
jgi:phospholipid transport system substrate-binding protein